MGAADGSWSGGLWCQQASCFPMGSFYLQITLSPFKKAFSGNTKRPCKFSGAFRLYQLHPLTHPVLWCLLRRAYEPLASCNLQQGHGVTCPSCANPRLFLLPVWSSASFKALQKAVHGGSPRPVPGHGETLQLDLTSLESCWERTAPWQPACLFLDVP